MESKFRRILHGHYAPFQSVLAALALFVVLGCQSTPEGPLEPRSMQVLFLGHDSEHHHSAAFMPLLAQALSLKGVQFTYTDEPKSLNRQNLAQYDALMIYANHDEIKPSYESALLDFVKGGGAFLPIHSASYCFRNSSRYVKLVGAQFESHDTATFTADIVDSGHPIMDGFEPFETWDETYVHTLHARDRTVLMERVDGDHREPWTWVKEYGKGRVFYTAYGHDERTWTHPAFQDLIYRGLIWALGDRKSAALAALTMPSLEHSEAKIPNYEKRDPPPQFQAALSPEQSQQLIQIPQDYTLSLFASEPDIINPIAMNWDERGRLWILETVDYPNEIKVEPGIGRDRITILEDTDKDGTADKFTVFADSLSVPTSIVFHKGGVIVSQAPHFLYLKDTDGDDRADMREIIMDGWGTFDTHAGPSNLRYGFDNKIWGVLGYSGFEGTVGEDEHKFSQGIYRFDQDGSELEFMSRTSNNTWGLGFSETFDVFISTANNTHSGYYGIPHKHLLDAKGIYMQGVEKIDGHYLFHPITANFRQVDVFGGFTAAAGHALYTARDFPSEFWNRIALVAEPTGHLLHKAILEKEGAGFAERDGWNLLASADEWVSPVAAEVGPDGAVWILDWYNFIIQHNPQPEGFEMGAGNAHINPLRDKQRGRIYRLSHNEAEHISPPALDPNSPPQLLEALTSDNLLWRMHAQRLLVESGDAAVQGALVTLLADESTDAQGLNSGALHAVWTLHGLGLVTAGHPDVLDQVEAALWHPAAGVRKAAIMALPTLDRCLQSVIESGILNDEDLHTRLAAINRLHAYPASEALAEELVKIAQDEVVTDDLWLSRATYLVAVKHKNEFIQALLKDNPDILASDSETEEVAIDFLAEDLDLAAWGDIEIPNWLGQTNVDELSNFDGIFWVRRTIELTEELAARRATLYLSGADDVDVTYVNGTQVGTTEGGWDTQREYRLPRRLLRAGTNTISVQLTDAGGGGGIVGDPDSLYLACGDERFPLAGTWKYRVEKTVTSAVSPFKRGENVISLFLKHYGPYAQEYYQDLEEASALVDRTYTIKTIRDQMKYDVTEIEAHPGEIVEITFENNDGMQHNLLVLEPGSLIKVGTRAEEFAKEKEAAEQQYKPDLQEILFWTPLLNPGEQYKLRFKVPDEVGVYPYVCTFPGHWQTMNGELRVTAQAVQ